MTATRRDDDQDLDLDDLNLGEDDPLLTGDDKLDDTGLDDLDGDVLDDDFEEPAPRPKKRQSLSLMTMVLMLVLVVVGGAFLLLNNQSVSRAITTPMAPPAQPVPGAEVSPIAAAPQEAPAAAPAIEPAPASDTFADIPQPDVSNNNEAPVDVGAAAPALPPTTPLDAPEAPVAAEESAPTSTSAPVAPAPVADAAAPVSSPTQPDAAVATTAPAPVPVPVPTTSPATPTKDVPASVPAEPTVADVPASVPTMPADMAPTQLVAQDPTPVSVPEKEPVQAAVTPQKTEPLADALAVVPEAPTKIDAKSDVKLDVKPEVKPSAKPEVKKTTGDEPVATTTAASSKPKAALPPAAPVKDQLKPEDFYSANETVESLSRMTAPEFPSGQGADGRDNSVSVRPPDASDPESELALANRALDLERYDAALEMFDKLYRQNKSDERILMGRAIALQNLGRNDEAIKAYDDLLAQNPDNPTVMTNMLGLVRKQYPSVALQRLLELRQRYPQNATVAAQAGLAQASIGNLEEGLRYLGIAAGLEPENPKHYFNMGVIAERLGKPELAIDSYEKALQADALSSDPKTAVDRDVIYDRLSVLRQKM